MLEIKNCISKTIKQTKNEQQKIVKALKKLHSKDNSRNNQVEQQNIPNFFILLLVI